MDMQNNVNGIAFAYRAIFADALEASDSKAARAVDDGIRPIVAAPVLRQ